MDQMVRWSMFIRYCLHDYWDEAADPRTKDFPLISSGPWKIFLIVSVYLLFVKYWGPKFMEHRRPYTLRQTMLWYNIGMVVINFLMFYNILIRVDGGRRFLQFKFPDPSDRSDEIMLEIRAGYYYYLFRYLDLIDTVFFVLRKKYQQITFLHLYHHGLVPVIGYLTVKIAPVAPVVILFLMFNTFIHTVMYSYYALASFGPKFRQYLWWKKYITQMQMAQFLTCGVYGCYMIFVQEGFPPGLFWVGFAQNPIFFYMFYDFYIKSFVREQREKQQFGISKHEEQAQKTSVHSNNRNGIVQLKKLD